VGILFQEMPVLEGAGFTLIDIDRHEPGFRLVPDYPPLAACGKTGATQAPQSGILEGLNHLIRRESALFDPTQKLVATSGPVGIVVSARGMHG